MPIMTTRGARAPFLASPDSDAGAFVRSGLLADYWIDARAPAGRASAIGPTPAADAPPVANDDNFTTDEVTVITGNLFADNGHGMDNDPDGPPLTIATVNGSAVNVGVQVMVGSGALLTVNADGSFTYDPNHGFDSTPAAGSGAANTPGHETFSYTLTGGGSALMFVSINGIDNNDTLFGTAGADTLTSGVGNDRLFGLGGADTMSGGTGDDTYFVDDTGDQVIEADSAGYDVVAVTGFYILTAGSHVELLTTGNVSATASTTIIGNEFANEIWGNNGSSFLSGGGGNDALLGFGGNDDLDGGAGADLLIGGTGQDTYVVDNPGDVIVDSDNSVVRAAASYALAAGLPVNSMLAYDLAATTPINLTGNEFDQSIQGNEGDNSVFGLGGVDVLSGHGGNDALYGGDGHDTLDGGTGNDILDGGAGADGLNGQLGDDTYFVDDVGDFILEQAGGFDTVAASVSYTLAASSQSSIELLTTGDINGSGAINLTGNDIANQIWGNAAGNTLNGAGGNDALIGFGGNDTLIGGAGADLFVGGDGSDSLTGGTENDLFAFTAALGATNVDNVVDFAVGADKLLLEDAVFTGLTLGTLAPEAFVVSTQARDADDRIIYNPVTGELFFDADGTGAGAQILFATLQGAPTISATDFTVI